MFAIARTLTLLFLALAALPVPLCAAETKTPPAEKLIEQLGDNDFAQRERAARMLQKRGPVVLPALRKARNHADAEVRRRVRAMIPILERAAALTPKRVTLDDKPRTLSAVLKEIEKQTGYKVKADADGEEKLHCFKMNEMPFWEALERIGRQTGRAFDGINEAGIELERCEKQSPFVMIHDSFRVEVTQLDEARRINFAYRGKGTELHFREFGLTLTLNLWAEPRFIFFATSGVRVVIADKDGKQLGRPAVSTNGAYYDRREIIQAHFLRAAEILLRPSSGKMRTIKVLRGIIPVQIVAERKRVVLTDNVLKAVGKKRRLRDGTVEFTGVSRTDNGDPEIHLVAPADRKGDGFSWFDRFHVEDAVGNSYKDLGRRGECSDGAPTQQITLTCHAAKNPKFGPPNKLIVEDWITLRYDIPFEFKDIPLP